MHAMYAHLHQANGRLSKLGLVTFPDIDMGVLTERIPRILALEVYVKPKSGSETKLGVSQCKNRRIKNLIF